MPIEFRYDQENQVLRAAMMGPPSLAAFEEAMETITNSDDYPADVRTLWDLRKLDFSAVDRVLEDKLVAIRRRYPERENARMAFIVADQLGFGMTRMFQIVADAKATQVFTDYTKAEQWLLSE